MRPSDREPDGRAVERTGARHFPSRSSLTQPPNEFAERIYSRMPVILDVEEARAWLEPLEP